MRARTIDRKIHQVTEHRSVAAFCDAATTPPGINTIIDGDLPIDVLNVPGGGDTTLVFLHGAMENGVRLPVLTGQSVSRGVTASRVFISDPSLVLSEELFLAWYAGNYKQPDLATRLVDIISKLAADHASRRVVLFGGSGGGFAAMRLAAQLDHSLALVFNPQTNIARYFSRAVRRFTEHAFLIDEAEYDPLALLPDGVITDLCALYDRPVRGAVAYMQNLNDSSHIERHLKPFIAQIHGDNEMYLLAEAWSLGHTPPPKSLLTATLESVTTMPTWSQGLTSVGFERVDPGGLRRIQVFGSSAASKAAGRE